MKTIRKRLYILIAAATIACAPLGMLHGMKNQIKVMLPMEYQLKLLGNKNTLPKLNEIVRGAQNAQLKFSKTTLPTKIGLGVNSYGAPLTTSLFGGYFVKKMAWDQKISFPELLCSIVGVTSGVLWWNYKKAIQDGLKEKRTNAKNSYDTTLRPLIETFKKIVGTEKQQKRKNRKIKTNKSEAYALRDFPRTIPRKRMFDAGMEIQKLKTVHQQLLPFAHKFGNHLALFQEFIERNEHKTPNPNNQNETFDRHTLIMDDETDDEEEEEEKTNIEEIQIKEKNNKITKKRGRTF